MANTPIFPALEAGATEILVVLLAPQTAWGMDSVLDLDPQHIKERIGADWSGLERVTTMPRSS